MDVELPRVLTHSLFELSSAVDLIGRAAAERLGINQTDLICLHLLVREGPMSAGQVAAALGLTTAAISAMATRLEAGGYASRTIDVTDRRRILLQASETGARQAFGYFDDLYQASVTMGARYSDRTINQLISCIAQFCHILVERTNADDR